MALKNYCYFVEGADEKKIIDTFKTDMKLIQPGKVYVVNPVQEKIPMSRIVPLKMGTTVILVFDTDTDNSGILKANIKLISSSMNVLRVICVTQVKNLEDELIRSCDIRNIRELTNSKSDREYKSDLIRITNLAERLKKCGFCKELFWCKDPDGAFKDIQNQADKIWL